MFAVIVGLSGCAADEPESQAVAAPAPPPPQVTDVTTPGARFSSKVVQLHTRQGVTQRILLLTPENPKASAILFAGGSGRIRLKRDGTLLASNVLVCSRDLFARRKIAVAVVDAPTDIRSLRTVAAPFGSRHRIGVDAVIG